LNDGKKEAVIFQKNLVFGLVMIFKLPHLEGIKAGKITLAFRKWKKLSVRKGSRIKTQVAVVEILDIEPVVPEQITHSDAVKAGFDNVENLLTNLKSVDEGTVYRIGVRFYSEDPRIELRARTEITDKDIDILKKKLVRLDQYSREGAWTLAVLKLIKNNPKVRAADLAAMMQQEKDFLKINIRKLKNLGLTISHEVGYTLSPLGELMIRKLS
jgi:hypothetical protein